MNFILIFQIFTWQFFCEICFSENILIKPIILKVLNVVGWIKWLNSKRWRHIDHWTIKFIFQLQNNDDQMFRVFSILPKDQSEKRLTGKREQINEWFKERKRNRFWRSKPVTHVWPFYPKTKTLNYSIKIFIIIIIDWWMDKKYEKDG